MKAIIDTNVLLVANNQHDNATDGCKIACIDGLMAIKQSGIVVIDDDHRILEEYLHKTNPRPKNQKEIGNVFLKWLLQHCGTHRVEQVSLNEQEENIFSEFPDAELQHSFDPPDRKFAAVAHAHPDKPEIWQAVDCKWLDWWPALLAKGVRVNFLCPDDVCGFYRKKFPKKPLPDLPH